MKLFGILFSTFMVSVAIVNGQEDYRQEASYLLNNVYNVIKYVDEVDQKVTDAHNNLATIVYALDFAVSSNPLMVELEQDLINHKGCKGIHNCEELKNSTTLVVKRTLQTITKDLVEKQLYYYRTQLYYTRQRLYDISYELQGHHLEKEIQACTVNPLTCRIRRDFPNEVEKDQQYADLVDHDLHLLVNHTLESKIYPLLPLKIRLVIYGPTTECINHVSHFC